MCSRSDVHKVNDPLSGAKGILNNSSTEQKISCRHGAAHVKLLLSVLRIQYRKVQEMQIFGMFWRQFFAGAGDAKGETHASTADK